MPKRVIGLALSGGGSRAMAFHLGCLRALQDKGLLEQVHVLSGVSGGSVIAAMYAYSNEPFEEFEKRVEATLRRGLVWGIARETFFSLEAFRIIAAIATAGLAAAIGTVIRLIVTFLGLLKIGGTVLPRIAEATAAGLPRFASRSTAFEKHLRRHFFSDKRMNAVSRAGLNVVLNAAELRTETAFRFGSRESGCWRYGKLVEVPNVATAVAASAAFPAALPAFDRVMKFVSRGETNTHRLLITDGGVYDNLGISCMTPGRTAEFSTNAYEVDFIIACDAGQGTPTGSAKAYFWGSRMRATINTIHRRVQTLTQSQLHSLAANGQIEGFILPYLGQIDERLPYRPDDLVPREKTLSYPTNFSPMSEDNIALLSSRGEQLTRIILEAHAPYL